MKRAIFLKIFGGSVLLILLVGGLSLAFSFRLIRTHYERAEARNLESLGRALLPDVEAFLDANDADGLEGYIKKAGLRIGARLTVIAPDGTVWADSEVDPATMENHRYRPEVQEAVEGRVGRSERFSYTVVARMLYVGLPLVEDGRVRAVVRQSIYLKYIDELLADLKKGILRAAMVMAALALTAAALFSLHLTSPIRLLTKAARRVAGGDFETRVHFRRRDEFRLLGEKFNEMTERLSDSFADITRRKEELVNIITSIREGLAVIDGAGRLALVNEAFKALAGAEAAEGRLVWEVVRSAGFQEVIGKARLERSPQAAEFRMGDKSVWGTAGYLPQRDGVLVVLSDLSVIRRVEDVKRDFVVNVSHELRTPLAALSGAVEILEDGGGAATPAAVEILRRHTDRLKAIVDDLLKLAALEDRGFALDVETVDLKEIAARVVESYASRFRDKGLDLRLEAPPEPLLVAVDAFQIERLLSNLVDNALKSTERGSAVICLRAGGGGVEVDVADTGIGIPEEHLPRIFERFYVVDKSRSRRFGGTGLGLSIVKHIAERHGGTVLVRSAVGRGTTFTVRFPAVPAAGKP
jgi:two-component system phosphate regulon sensor histidine kinase PhoR